MVIMKNNEELQIELTSDKLKQIGDTLITKVYLGQTEYMIKEGTIIKIYDKGNYNMLLIRFKGKIGHYHQCSKQLKDTFFIF